MPLRIPLETIILRGRGPQAVKPVIGKPFDFTKAELAGILATNKDAVRELTETEAAAYAHKATVASQQNKTVAAAAPAAAAPAKPETAKEKKARLDAEKAAAIAAQQKATADELANGTGGEGTGGEGTGGEGTGGEGTGGDEDI